MRSLLRGLAALTVVAVALLGLSACGGGSTQHDSGPTKALARAKKQFDAARGVHLTLTTDAQPRGNGVLGADGTLTDAPAFKGKVKVQLNGFSADVPVVSVNGKVYAKLPLTTGWSAIDPGQYGAPDPADFKDPSTGISTLLTRMKHVSETGKRRDGKLVLTSYTGTLTGEQVSRIIPSAGASGEFDTEVGLDDGDRIRTLSVTGPFFSGIGRVTYDLTFDDYGKSVRISKP